MSDAPEFTDLPEFAKLRELLQALLPEEQPKIKELGGQEELLSFALQTYEKLQEKGSQTGTPASEQEELKNALMELIPDEAGKAPLYLNYPEASPLIFEFWAEAESYEAVSEHIRKTLYGTPHNAPKLLYCYRNKTAPIQGPEALQALQENPELLFREKEYTALAKVMNPELIYRALHLNRAIRKMNVFGIGTQESVQESGKEEENDTESLEEIVSERFMQIHELRRSS
ncbi:hypothetical protein ACSAZK_00740 [Methanosarcina sp. Mfa9]|uniref:hypothetical protein n=1 Tax=Methanosarcina sp. Mfa9 TaxID=3439063 RepID=UPI003F84EBEA